MKIINEFRRLTEEIAVCESQKQSLEREINKQSDQYKPKEIKAIDYEEEKVETSTHQQSMIDTYDEIVSLNCSLKERENELDILYAQRNHLEDVVDGMGDRRKKAIMMRIKRKKPYEIEEATGYCERHVHRIVKAANIKCEEKNI